MLLYEKGGGVVCGVQGLPPAQAATGKEEEAIKNKARLQFYYLYAAAQDYERTIMVDDTRSIVDVGHDDSFG